MKIGDRIHLEGAHLTAALASGLVEPHGTDAKGVTVYVLTRAGHVLTGAGTLSVGQIAQRIQAAHPLLFGRGPTVVC